MRVQAIARVLTNATEREKKTPTRVLLARPVGILTVRIPFWGVLPWSETAPPRIADVRLDLCKVQLNALTIQGLLHTHTARRLTTLKSCFDQPVSPFLFEEKGNTKLPLDQRRVFGEAYWQRLPGFHAKRPARRTP